MYRHGALCTAVELHVLLWGCWGSRCDMRLVLGARRWMDAHGWPGPVGRGGGDLCRLTRSGARCLPRVSSELAERAGQGSVWVT